MTTVAVLCNDTAMDAKLRKSVRTYRKLLADLPPISHPVQPDDLRRSREVADYLRSLYAEFGQKRVRAAIEELRVEL